MRSPFSDNDSGYFWAWAVAFIPISVAIHIVGLVFLPERLPPKLAQNRPVEMEIVHIPPPEEVLEPEPPEPEPPPPMRPPPARPPPARPPPVKPPPQAPPPPNEEAPQQPDKPVPIVAGVTLSSTTEAGTFSAPVGNTSHGSMQGPATRPEDVKAYSADRVDYAFPSEVDVEPAVLSEFKPPYPEVARKAGIEGTVRLRLWLDAQGKVQRVRVVRKVGYGLDEAAQEAIMRFKFRPARKGGKPVPINFTFDFHFYLD